MLDEAYNGFRGRAQASAPGEQRFFLPGYEFALTLLGASVALALTGPDRFAVDRWLGLEA
jgi:uncharacterized membrane protein YphA (DoxX/SURF4 family)